MDSDDPPVASPSSTERLPGICKDMIGVSASAYTSVLVGGEAVCQRD